MNLYQTRTAKLASQTLSIAVYVDTDALAAWGARASAPRRRRCGPCQTACAVVASLTRKKSAKCAGFIHCVGRVIDRANIIAQDQGSGGASSAHKSFVRSLPRARAEQLWLKRVDLQRALLEPHPHQAQTPRSLRSTSQRRGPIVLPKFSG